MIFLFFLVGQKRGDVGRIRPFSKYEKIMNKNCRTSDLQE